MLHKSCVPLIFMGVFVAASLLSQAPAAQAQTEVCFATPDDGATVFSSTTASAVRQALALAPAGGTVKVAGHCAGTVLDGGTAQVARITQTVTLAGGYTVTNWLAADPLTHLTTLDAQGAGRVISATADALTLYGFTVAHGTITDTEIISGAGLYAAGHVTLTAMTFINNNNIDSVWPSVDGEGGGAYVAGQAVVIGTSFISNTTDYGTGGGAYFKGPATLIGTRFISNTASFAGGAYFFGTANVTGATFISNTTISDGGGAFFGGPATLTGTSFISNTAGAGGGGRIFLAQRVW